MQDIMSECLELVPVPVCGWKGKCVSENETASKFCKCESGFSQSLEWNFFVEEDSLKSSICLYNESVIEGLYAGLLVVAVFDFCVRLFIIVHTGMIKNKGRFLRHLPFLVFVILVIATCSYRLADPEALFGVDFTFSFMLGVFSFTSILQAYIVVNKYLNYVSSKVSVNFEQTYFLRAHISRRIYKFINLVVIIILSNFWWVCVLTERRTSLLLMRIYTGCNTVRVLYQLFFYQVSLYELVVDMKAVIFTIDDNFTKVTLNQDFVSWVEKRIPQVDRMRKNLLVIGTLEMLVWLLITVWDFWFHLMVYLTPVYILLIFLNDLTIIRGSLKPRFRSFPAELVPPADSSVLQSKPYNSNQESLE